MKVYVITLQLDHEGAIVQEVWEKKDQAEHRVEYLNKNKAGVCERYEMIELKLISKHGVNHAKVAAEDKE